MVQSEHTIKQYDVDLDALRTQVLQMGGLVESQIQAALEVYATGNRELADRVMEDDRRVNGYEVRIDNDCSHIIVRRQPAATDLRTVLAITKTVTDLERIGDHAKNMAEYVIYMVKGTDVRHTDMENVERQAFS